MIGQQFGNYRAVSLLGEGGMGAVYLAEHPAIGRRVAVKVLHKNYIRDENLLTRFLNEARAANAIRHPNIIEILDSGTIADGTPFLVMELLEGESLGTRIRRVGALPIQTAVEFCYQTASALGAAHKKGIVHRDLKPDNLFVVPDPHDPERERIKVLDFGIAKLQQSANDSVKTRTGTLMGTPIYMSPEQCRGTKTVDHRSDIYSLGIIFFEMLCGQPPFVSEGFGELVNMHLNVAPQAPSSQNPDVSPAIDAIVLKMLSKNPDERFADMGELQAALKSSGGSMFVVRGTQPSSPDMKNTARTAPKNGPTTGAATAPGGAGSSNNPKLRDTTFSTGVGERVEGEPGGSKKGKAAMVFVVAAAAGGCQDGDREGPVRSGRRQRARRCQRRDAGRDAAGAQSTAWRRAQAAAREGGLPAQPARGLARRRPDDRAHAGAQTGQAGARAQAAPGVGRRAGQALGNRFEESAMAESDGLIEVLKEIRDEIRAVRTELGDRRAPMAASGLRTEVVERRARWRTGATAGIGAMALVALVLSLRAGGQASPAVVATAPQMSPGTMTASTAMTTTPAPTAMPAPAPTAMPAPVATKPPPPARATKPAATRPALAQQPAGAPAVVAVPKRLVKPAVAPKLPAAVPSDEDDAIAFSPPPRRVRVHRMSYGPVDSQPAKL